MSIATFVSLHDPVCVVIGKVKLLNLEYICGHRMESCSNQRDESIFFKLYLYLSVTS